MGYKKRVYHNRKCDKCNKELIIRSDYLKKHSGLCGSCLHQKRPFESIYNKLFNDHRKTKIELTYEEFLQFTKEKNCNYCLAEINWIPYPTVDGKYLSSAYYLDRRNNTGSYSLDNCVVCCTKCNQAKGNRYTYEEWYGMTEFLRNKWYAQD